MWRFFTATNTRRYLDVLQKLLESYNNSYHKSIKMTPMQVTSENTSQVFENLYGTFPIRRKNDLKMKFNVGDLVRI